MKYRDKINQIKLERGCVDCGYKSHFAALEFDHLRDKKFNLGDRTSHTWEECLEEIAKCEVVCSNCHRVRTATRKATPEFREKCRLAKLGKPSPKRGKKYPDIRGYKHTSQSRQNMRDGWSHRQEGLTLA